MKNGSISVEAAMGHMDDNSGNEQKQYAALMELDKQHMIVIGKCVSF